MKDEQATELDVQMKIWRAKTLRRRRVWAGVILGNAAVLVLMIGGPYMRARARATHGRERFAELVACMWGGTPVERPGLVLPEGEREHYVDRFREVPEWPRGCIDELEAIVPDEATVLLPGAKSAEAEARRAVSMVRQELEAVDRAEDVVPSRPALAVQRLVAALSLWAEAADVTVRVHEPAVRFDEEARTVAPERIPYRAARDAEVVLRPSGDGVELVAMDARGISWVSVGGGSAMPRRLRRPGTVQGFLHAEGLWLVWHTPAERCVDGCGRRAMGLRRLPEDVVRIADPVWYAAHPLRTDALRIEGDSAWVLAEAESGVALRRFALVDEACEGPCAPEEEELLPPGTSLHLARGGEVLGIWEGRVQRWDGALEDLGIEGGSLEVCGDWWRVGRRVFFQGEARGEASGMLACEGEVLGAATEDSVTRCAASCVRHPVALGAHRAVAVLGQAVLVAHGEDERQVVVLRVEEEVGEAMRPAACWSEEGEHCGRPLLGARNGRAVLGAIDDGDLMVVETSDGERWRPLRGLR